MPTVIETNITLLDDQIQSVLNVLDVTDPGEADFQKHLDQLDKLTKIRKSLSPDNIVVEEKTKSKVNLKDWIPTIGSLSGILVIVAAESFGHILTSKATSFVSKMK